MITYEPLAHTLITKHLNRETLIQSKIISRATSAKLGKNAYVSLEVIDRICSYLDCTIQDVVQFRGV